MPNTRTISKLIFVFALTVIFSVQAQEQTKRLKRPSSRVGISSVDTFVRESFDLYDKVYMYEGYAMAGTPLSDDDIDVLEIALDDLLNLSNSAPNILSDIDNASFLKQAKATLQLNRAKKALSYSIKTAKKLLADNKKGEESEDDSDDETITDDESATNDETDDSLNDDPENDQDNDEEAEEPSNVSDNLEIYRKFDFVPGDKLLFFDDFSQDFIGDFPSKWNTNGTGEVVKVNTVEGNWFEVKSGYNIFYIPLLEEALPEEYTIEFDLLTSGMDRRTSSTALMYVRVDDNDSFKEGTDLVQVSIPFCQYAAIDINIQNKKNGKRDIYSNLGADIRDAVLNQPHISIAVNKQRFRMWVNERKYVDVPRLVPENKLQFIKFRLHQLKDDKERVFIRNLKVAEGGVDLRRKLMSEGRISTNGILFDSGSATIQPQSYGIIRQISQVLIQDKTINLNIIGHTDSDGADDANMKLSKARADAVREALITIYKISGDRLQTDGKGESLPVGDNNTSDGKAQNRRVEFVKI